MERVHIMLVWENDFRTGIEDIDAQHIILFALINQLDININNELPNECVHDTLKAVAYYIDFHFAYEEMLMRQRGFPALEEHLAEHRLLMQTVVHLAAPAAAPDSRRLAFRMRHELMEWMLSHMQADRRFADFCHARHIGEDAPATG